MQSIDLAEFECLPEQLNITTNINNDCLYHIFEYLELKDLMNVAETCKALCDVTSQFFGWKYSGNKIVGIGDPAQVWKEFNVAERLGNEEVNRKWQDVSIVASTPLMALKLLRNFGHTITNLHISEITRKVMVNLEQYLTEYCCESLENILLTHCELQFISNPKKSCINVETMIVFHCNLYRELPLCTYFPNVKSLTLVENELQTYFTKIAFPFSALTHLSFSEAAVSLYSPEIELNHQESEIIEFLKLNPQIEQLNLMRLPEYYSRDLLQCLVELPKLRRLALQNDLSDLFYKDDSDDKTFYSDSVEHFSLSSRLWLDVYHIPIVFTRLKSLSLNTTGMTEMFFTFITKHPEVKSIYVNFDPDTLRKELRKYQADKLYLLHQFENISSSIEELTIGPIQDFQEVALLRFLKRRHKLKTFSLSGLFHTRSLSELHQSLCDAMISNDIQFKIMLNENVNENGTIKLYIENFNNSSKMQNVIKIFSRGEITDIDWYTINE